MFLFIAEQIKNEKKESTAWKKGNSIESTQNVTEFGGQKKDE